MWFQPLQNPPRLIDRPGGNDRVTRTLEMSLVEGQRVGVIINDEYGKNRRKRSLNDFRSGQFSRTKDDRNDCGERRASVRLAPDQDRASEQFRQLP